jgi:hypothetical protein
MPIILITARADVSVRERLVRSGNQRLRAAVDAALEQV